MRVVTWVVEGTWAACVDATRRFAPDDADVVLLHVSGEDVSAAAHGAYAGLLGRGPRRDPGPRLAQLGAASAAELLEAAARALDRPCQSVERRGRVEREVVAAAEGADLLVLARDGDVLSRLGPKSLGPASRFVVDHAPCPVLLVWPREIPGTGSIPPPPPHSPHPPHHTHQRRPGPGSPR
jgi:nucleotide-binding universal stress UspA family protein